MARTDNDKDIRPRRALAEAPSATGDPAMAFAPRAAYPQAVDAIVLAGTHQNPRRLVNGRNKAFLEIEGMPLVHHVVDALVRARHVDRVYVVGPADELAGSLGGYTAVHCVPQEGKMLSNSWAAIRAAEAAYSHLPEAQVQARPLLIVSSDLPLITAEGVDDFIERCAAVDAEAGFDHALLVGVAEEEQLKLYYGDSERPGIQRPPVHLDSGLLRLANIYIARPRHLAHHEFLQTSFSYRKAKDWRNVMKLVISLFRQHGGWAAAWLTMRLQLAAMLSRGKGRWYQKIRAGNTVARVEDGVSTVLGGPVRMVETPFGGLSLDVDDADDYQVLISRYREWMPVIDPESPGTAP